MSSVVHLDRPQRWDSPFGDMSDADVADLLATSPFDGMDAGRFPRHTPLEGILANDTRIVRLHAGDLVVREGDYGNSAFLVLDGSMRVVLGEGLPGDRLGRLEPARKGVFGAIAQLWRNSRVPEARDPSRYGRQAVRENEDPAEARVVLQDVPGVLDAHQTVALEKGTLFGELAALGRIPRTASVFAETDGALLEIRWQGLREIRKYDDGFRRYVDDLYRRNALTTHLEEAPIFQGLPPETIREIADATLFETYGSFDWHGSYQRAAKKGEAADEPVIAREGDYPDGLLMIRAGFARISIKYGNGRRTLSYLGAGGLFGLHELHARFDGEEADWNTSLTALGYVDVLRVPAPILEKHVFPHRAPEGAPLSALAERAVSEDALQEWLVENRFVNATEAMLIDLDKCVRCDDCVRACASTHDGNPRFLRHGKTFDHWMVANACMHCADPVCMIGCPTGAIHRSQLGGEVVINDDTCIGCGTCAASCPYDNIRMVEIADRKGRPVIDPATEKPIQKATKCDLCADNPGGPACVRACPHDALERADFAPVRVPQLSAGRDPAAETSPYEVPE